MLKPNTLYRLLEDKGIYKPNSNEFIMVLNAGSILLFLKREQSSVRFPVHDGLMFLYKNKLIGISTSLADIIFEEIK